MSEIPNKIAVIEKAVRILEFMVDYPYGISLSELESGVQLNKSTIYRILFTLKDNGYIIQNPDDAKYRIGPRFLLYQSVFDETDLARAASPELRRLAASTGDICHLVIRDHCEGVYIDKVDPPESSGIAVRSRVGARVPLHCTSVGKVLLADLSEGEVDDIIAAAGLPARTPQTITDPLRLKRELDLVRRQGYAVDDLENEENVRCVAAPIRDHVGKVVAAVSSTGTILSVTSQTMPSIICEVRHCGEQISRSLGYRIK
ncbi:IclR family transcriptional regulator [Bacilliculturomica massiliensis]|uniref:IclR family transcriptional regulator n=1 Tax=Bacilliculturomica massiliensis TaxID=1917867 RepID=UPI0010309137|nr:IclR family transcriptional regulator [Bacilliculturomica massiliensis]